MVTEASQTAEEARIQQEIQVAKPAGETQITVEPNTDPNFHQEAMKVLSAGFSWIYDPKTGERSKAINYMLPALLRLKEADDTPRFTTIKPPFEPPKGEWKCLLHKDAPNRTRYNEMGFAVCPAGNLSSRYQRDRHMQRKHKTEYAAIQDEQRTQREQEDREARKEDRKFQRTLMERLTGKPAKEKPATGEFACDVCGKALKTKLALSGHKRSHK